MGVTGIHADYGLTTGDREEAAVKRAICRRSAETFALGSREKLGSVSTSSVVDFDDIESVVVSRSCPEALLIPLRTKGV